MFVLLLLQYRCCNVKFKDVALVLNDGGDSCPVEHCFAL